jgi:hypothetical protein
VSEIRSFWLDAMTFAVKVAETPLHWNSIPTSYQAAKSLGYRPDNQVFAFYVS